jgi:hypothetical protein
MLFETKNQIVQRARRELVHEPGPTSDVPSAMQVPYAVGAQRAGPFRKPVRRIRWRAVAKLVVVLIVAIWISKLAWSGYVGWLHARRPFVPVRTVSHEVDALVDTLCSRIDADHPCTSPGPDDTRYDITIVAPCTALVHLRITQHLPPLVTYEESSHWQTTPRNASRSDCIDTTYDRLPDLQSKSRRFCGPVAACLQHHLSFLSPLRRALAV